MISPAAKQAWKEYYRILANKKKLSKKLKEKKVPANAR